jgi:hypothetical protein
MEELNSLSFKVGLRVVFKALKVVCYFMNLTVFKFIFYLFNGIQISILLLKNEYFIPLTIKAFHEA